MEKSQPSDPELLAEWLKDGREAAFRDLVSRYTGLVYLAAKRTCGDETVAAEAAQLTFILLARKAGSISNRTSIAGWLHLTAVMQAKNLIRKNLSESRKRQHLQTAMEAEPDSDHGDSWKQIQPVLDDALAKLSEKDREVLLLRFYRSLSIREIAKALGIATDTAQKRIDRATGRLREKLARRGVQTGVSLGVVIAAGFAADAQAAVPLASILAAKALAAGAGSAGILSIFSITLPALAMKTTSFIPPFVALLAAGVWFGSQFVSIAKLEEDNARLKELLALVTRPAAPVPRAATAFNNPLEQEPIDWQEVCRQLNNGGAMGIYLRTNGRLVEALDSWEPGKLLTALDEIQTASLSQAERELLEGYLSSLLASKDPEAMVKRFFGKGTGWETNFRITQALAEWAKRNPEEAAKWFDGQIKALRANGDLMPGQWGIQIQSEQALVRQFISSDPEMARLRLMALPEDQRIEAFRSGGPFRMNREDWPALAKVARQVLPEKDRLNVITWPVTHRGDGSGRIEFTDLENYFKEIEATPQEREACILGMAKEEPKKIISLRPPDSFEEAISEDLEILRAWVKKESPELVDRATSQALVGILRSDNFSQVARLAVRYHEVSSNDEILTAILTNTLANLAKEEARELAGKLRDPANRDKFLQKFK